MTPKNQPEDLLMTMKSLLATSSLALLLAGTSLAANAQIAIGHLEDLSGGTSDVGTPYGQGVVDTFAWINKNGGIGGKQLAVDSVDYGYQVPRAIALYKKWSGSDKVAAIMGWGTADTEALTGFLANDKIPDLSGSYAAALTDPTGVSGKSKPSPYNFFYGPSYSDSLRAELTWAAEDWKAKGKTDKPKFVHMGANHPYPNAPKAAGEAMAKELGFEVLPPLVFALAPGDYSAQCLSLKSAGANYAYLGNTAASNISVMKACKAAGAEVQFMSNVWGMDENAAKTAGDAADGVIFPLRTAVSWGGDAPGMKTVMDISKMSDPSGTAYRPVHYLAGVCSTMYMKEALDWAAKNGGATGENVRNAFYQKKDWVPAGMEGVCNPSTWTEKDHRPTMKVDLYRSKVTGSTDGDMNDVMKKGAVKLEKVKTIELPRKAELLGW
jgi:branched-chain amino acid transport system substrate-binding protein